MASLPVVIRSVSDATVVVKGRASTIIVDGPQPVVRISNISERGMEHLAVALKVQVEFVMMSTKVVFVSQLVQHEVGSITLSLPISLVSIERRKNARYACTDDLTAFLRFSVWRPNANDPLGPPFFPHGARTAAYIPIADVSSGGLCAVSRFPTLSVVLKRGLIDDRAQLILPMQSPLAVSVEIRWAKRIRELAARSAYPDAYQRFYRFGIEFNQQSDEIRGRLRQFIQQLSQAGAV